MSGRDLRLAPIAASAWAAALLVVLAPTTAWWCAAGGVVGAGILFALHRRLAPAALLALALLVFSATALAAALRLPDRAAAAAWDGTAVRVDADITSSATVGADGRLWFDARTVSLGPADEQVAIAVPVRIGVDPLDGADFGAGIRVTGQAMATDAGEQAVLVVFADRAEIVRPAGGVFAVAAGVRGDFVERAGRLPEPGAGLLPGLAVGDTRAVTAELNAAMITSGLSHLTAVSGANCAIVVGAAFWIVGLCGGGRGLRVGTALATLAAFVVLVTPEPSVVRAAVMAGLAMLTILLGRPGAGAGVLFLAVVVILVGDPWLGASPGFALSAAATASLILLARPLARGFGRWMPAPLALAVAVPVAAQLACGPIIALFSEQQSIIGVAANLLAEPAAPIATVVGLLACLLSALPPLADLLTACAWLPAAWIEMTARVSAALPGAKLLVEPGIPTAFMVLVLSTALCVLLWRRRSGGPPPQWLTAPAAGLLVVAVALAGARMLLRGPLVEAAAADGWSIAACDVGQGDALVVKADDEYALIDTGPDPALLRECLISLGVRRIDVLVLTHFDLDHAGGADAVVGRVGAVLHGPVSEPPDERLLEAFQDAGAEVVSASAGMTGSLGSAQWRVLWPRASASGLSGGNDASVVWEVSGAGVPHAVFLGDLSALPQRLIAASGQLRPPYDVVKVAHHGSADQYPQLYAMLRPAAAVISVGENDYGHPRSETLDLLEAAGATVLRTDERGRILLGLGEGGVTVRSERRPGSDVDGAG